MTTGLLVPQEIKASDIHEEPTPFDIEHASIDEAEKVLAAGPQVEVPTEHAWIFGFYVRKVILPAGMLLVTKTHGQRHVFTILRGRCLVRGLDGVDRVFEAPYVGVTEAGERRRILVETETEWVTFQYPPASVLETAVKNIEDAIMIPRSDLRVVDQMNRPIQPVLPTHEP